MNDLGSSVHELINPSDLLYFADILFLLLLLKYKPKHSMNADIIQRIVDSSC